MITRINEHGPSGAGWSGDISHVLIRLDVLDATFQVAFKHFYLAAAHFREATGKSLRFFGADRERSQPSDEGPGRKGPEGEASELRLTGAEEAKVRTCVDRLFWRFGLMLDEMLANAQGGKPMASRAGPGRRADIAAHPSRTDPSKG